MMSVLGPFAYRTSYSYQNTFCKVFLSLAEQNTSDIQEAHGLVTERTLTCIVLYSSSSQPKDFLSE